jgi:hypothetical protein
MVPIRPAIMADSIPNRSRRMPPRKGAFLGAQNRFHCSCKDGIHNESKSTGEEVLKI